jgi:hypothetical protein
VWGGQTGWEWWKIREKVKSKYQEMPQNPGKDEASVPHFVVAGFSYAFGVCEPGVLFLRQ